MGEVHRRGVLHVVGSGMEEGVEREGAVAIEVVGAGAPGHGVADGSWVEREVGRLGGIEADGRRGRLVEAPEEGFGQVATQVGAHQVREIVGQKHWATLSHSGQTETTPLMAGQGS